MQAVIPELQAVLKLVKENKIYWNRQGGSPGYQTHLNVLRELARQGLVRQKLSGCCSGGGQAFEVTRQGLIYLGGD